MSTATSATRSSPSRRSLQSTSPTPSPITRGATARSAVSPRVGSPLNSTSVRRNSVKVATPPIPNGETRESLSSALKQETEQKERLLVQIQDKEQLINSHQKENDQLTSALNAAETRINELYAEQSRSELEMSQRIEVSEKLRAQIRELEKEKRDLQKRYNEQTSTFEAERQAFYDNEQHLKSRIQSLSQARKQRETPVQPASDATYSESEAEDEDAKLERPQTPKQDLNDPEQEPAEMTALKLELSTLSTSHASLQSTLALLQSQLLDLKRVNNELQEENESYMILLRERTLTGQFDVRKQVGTGSEEDEDADDASGDVGSLRSLPRTTLNTVDEETREDSFEQELERTLESETDTSSSRHGRTRHGRKRGGSTSHSPSGAPRGESLADLPITGPGLDLAAELGRAENKDILAGDSFDDGDPATPSKGKRLRKDAPGLRTSESGLQPGGSQNDVDALRAEVKALKDANKALSLYASKIIDRIISEEGFEHVLAVDYHDKEPTTPSTATQAKPLPKARPQSVFVGRTNSDSSADGKITSPRTSLFIPPKLGPPPNPKAQRRSLSFDWRNFSLFNQEKKPDANPNLRPLTLKPGASPVTGTARKLDTQEDEEDRKERERLNATMKLMGIQPAPPSPVIIQKSVTSPGAPSSASAANRRFSLFGRSAPVNTETSSVHSTSSWNSNNGISRVGSSGGLTQEALEHAEAENSLAALDAHEKHLSAEIARGANGGFTELAPRAAGRRSRRSAGGSGSGSTVWSAGDDEE